MSDDFRALYLKAMDRIADLEWEIRELKSQGRLDENDDRNVAFREAFKIRRASAHILAHLHQRRGGVVTKSALMRKIYWEADYAPDSFNVLSVHIHHIRHGMPEGSIKTHWGHGWSLTEIGIKACDEALGDLKAAA